MLSCFLTLSKTVDLFPASSLGLALACLTFYLFHHLLFFSSAFPRSISLSSSSIHTCVSTQPNYATSSCLSPFWLLLPIIPVDPPTSCACRDQSLDRFDHGQCTFNIPDIPLPFIIFRADTQGSLKAESTHGASPVRQLFHR